MSNQASEDEQAMQHICQQTGEHYYASESIPGGLIHWIRICMACGHKDDKDLNEQVKALIRTEKLKLLAEVRERVVGENEPEFNTPKPEIGNMVRNRLREDQIDLLTKLEAEL
jgi:hypothetical protein